VPVIGRRRGRFQGVTELRKDESVKKKMTYILQLSQREARRNEIIVPTPAKKK